MRKIALVLVALSIVISVAACGGSAPSTPKVQADRTVTTDVVVVGAGGAGLTAAVEAVTLGAKVVLIEKTANPGGTTMLAGGGFDAAGTSLQKAANVDYPATRLADDIMKFGQNKGTKVLVDILAGKSGEAMDFLQKNGLKLRLANVQQYPTRHQAEAGGTGTETVKVLSEVAKSKGVTLEVNTTATELVVDAKGAVIGVKATDANKKTVFYSAKAVVLATGGFGANPQMLSEYLKDYPGIGSNLVARSATGDGIRMAKAIGADLVAMEHVQAYPTVSVKGAALRGVEGGGAILVNKQGQRFTNELTDNNTLSQAILRQEGKSAFLVFAGEYASRNEAAVKGFSDQGILLAGETVEELAGKMQVPAAALKATLDEYNKAVDAKVDTKFKRAALPLTHKQPKFYAISVQPAVYATLGGVRINDKGQVMKGTAVVPGLYAAGEVVGGIFGTNKFGVSTATSNIVFGRLAAQSAVASFKK